MIRATLLLCLFAQVHSAILSRTLIPKGLIQRKPGTENELTINKDILTHFLQKIYPSSSVSTNFNVDDVRYREEDEHEKNSDDHEVSQVVEENHQPGKENCQNLEKVSKQTVPCNMNHRYHQGGVPQEHHGAKANPNQATGEPANINMNNIKRLIESVYEQKNPGHSSDGCGRKIEFGDIKIVKVSTQ